VRHCHKITAALANTCIVGHTAAADQPVHYAVDTVDNPHQTRMQRAQLSSCSYAHVPMLAADASSTQAASAAGSPAAAAKRPNCLVQGVHSLRMGPGMADTPAHSLV